MPAQYAHVMHDTGNKMKKLDFYRPSKSHNCDETACLSCPKASLRSPVANGKRALALGPLLLPLVVDMTFPPPPPALTPPPTVASLPPALIDITPLVWWAGTPPPMLLPPLEPSMGSTSGMDPPIRSGCELVTGFGSLVWSWGEDADAGEPGSVEGCRWGFCLVGCIWDVGGYRGSENIAI